MAPDVGSVPAGRCLNPLPPARRTRVLETDLLGLLGALLIFVVGVWVRAGGVGEFRSGWSSSATSITQLSGLLASASGLVGLALVGRPRCVERHIGLDRMFVWHRVLGELMAVLVGVHVAAAIVSWSGAGGAVEAIRDLTGRQPYMALATVGALLIGFVTVTSLAVVRRRMSYETWYFVHLAAYAGFAISYGHQIVRGTVFGDDPIGRWAWGALHLGVIMLLVIRRWGATVRAIVRPLRIARIEAVAPDTVAVHLAGRGLGSLEASPGQFFFLRPLRARWWWQAHPFSLSAAPSAKGLRFSIKNRGDASGAIASLPLGTRVAVEGPYGTCTPEVLAHRKVLFIVGGVGVAPVRSLLESLGPENEPVVLFRASTAHDLVHIDEVRELVAARGGSVQTLVGPSVTLAVRDPFSAPVLRRTVPDVAERVVVVCGPDRLVWAARSGLRAAGVDPADVHYERSWW